MRASRAILVCACAAISILTASVWIGSSPRDRALPLAPEPPPENAGSQRESAALDATPAIDNTTRETPAPPGLHGRLVDSLTGAPIAGWTIRLECPAESESLTALHRYNVEARGPVSLRLEGASEPRRLVLEAMSLALAQADGTKTEAGLPVATASGHVAPGRVFLWSRGGTPPTPDAPSPQQELALDIVLSGVAESQAPQGEAAQPVQEASGTNQPVPIENPASDSFAQALVAGLPDAGAAPAEAPLPGNAVLTYNVLFGEPQPLQLLDGPTTSLRLQVRTELSLLSFQSARVAQPANFALLDAGAWLPTWSDHAVRSRRHGKLLAQCTTDADGRFELPCPDRDDAWLALVDQDPLYSDKPRRSVGAAARACSTPIRWETLLVERTLVRGQVLDVATQEPVPFLDVELLEGGQNETCTTDEQGRFASSGHFATGRVRAEFRDGPDGHAVRSPEPSALLSLSGDEVVFHVAIGPTYRFSWREGGAPTEPQVRIRGLVPADKDDQLAPDETWQPLRTEQGAFVRLPVPVKPVPGQVPWAEFVASDSLQRARMDLPHLAGTGDMLVSFTLGARLHGHVLDREGAPVGDASVTVFDVQGKRLDSVCTDEEGAWTIVGLDPRVVFSIDVAHDRHTVSHESHTIVRLLSGQDLELDLTVD